MQMQLSQHPPIHSICGHDDIPVVTPILSMYLSTTSTVFIPAGHVNILNSSILFSKMFTWKHFTCNSPTHSSLHTSEAIVQKFAYIYVYTEITKKNSFFPFSPFFLLPFTFKYLYKKRKLIKGRKEKISGCLRRLLKTVSICFK